jgi:glycosyltransferase involved in cell wall biosynthesis
MKIAVVTRYFPSSAEPSQGRSAYQTLRVLAREADVHVFYPNAAYPSVLRPRGRTYKALDPSYCPPDVKASYYNFPALPLVSRPVNGWLAARVLLPHVRVFAPDVIFSCFLYPDCYAALKIGKALGVPVVAMSIGSDINRIGDPLSAMFTRTVLRESDALVTVSGDLHRKAVSMGAPAASSRAILNGCDLSVFYPRDRVAARQKLQLDAACEAIVYIGRTDVRKGLRELVESVAALHRTRPNVHAYLIGWGPDKAILEGDIQRHDATSYIHLLPNCAFDDVAVWMAAANLVTLPSYMEGCPNVILEALASGRPVVATYVGGIPEIMSDACGRLVPPRDSVSLTKALDEVLETSWDAEAISSLWSRSWSAPAAELMQVFESVIAR